MTTTGSSRWPLALILLAALAARLGLLAAAWDHPDRLMTPDSASYDALARTLLKSGQFAPAPDVPAELFRTPGYPILLAGIYAVTGPSAQAAGLVGVCMDVIACYLVYRLGLILCSRRAGLWAAGLQAASTVAMVGSVRLLTESLFTLLFLASLVTLATHVQKSCPWALVLSALLAAAAAYVRPAGLFLGPLAAVALCAYQWRWRRGLAFAAIFVACLAPWVARNVVTSGFWGFSNLSTEAVYRFQAPAVLAQVEHVGLDDARAELDAQLAANPEFTSAAPGRQDAMRRELGLLVLRQHPGVFLKMHARGSLIVWAPAEPELLELLGAKPPQQGTLEVLQLQGLAAAVQHFFAGQWWTLWLYVPLGLALLLKYGLVAVTCIRQLRPRMGPVLWVLLVATLALAAAPGMFGHPRFRAPFEPILSLAAGAALARLLERRKPAGVNPLPRDIPAGP